MLMSDDGFGPKRKKKEKNVFLQAPKIVNTSR